MAADTVGLGCRNDRITKAAGVSGEFGIGSSYGGSPGVLRREQSAISQLLRASTTPLASRMKSRRSVVLSETAGIERLAVPRSATETGPVAGTSSDPVTSPVQLNLAPAGIDPPPVAIRLSHGITPRGKTPLTAAVVEPAETLSFRDNSATVVLTSDGIESCQADLVALMLTGLASIGPARTAFSGTPPR